MDFPSLAESAQARKEHRQPYMPPTNASPCLHEACRAPAATIHGYGVRGAYELPGPPAIPAAPSLITFESATYEVFEGDPVKYDQYESAIAEAMAEWKELKKPTSSVASEAHPDDELIVTVAGAGRGPLVTRVLRAADPARHQDPNPWALEKNQNAYVYLQRQNELVWNGKVTLVKTDMRGWEGPRPKGHDSVITKVDIPVTELLGSFGDNELSPECLDGIQRHLAPSHGTSIPHSYTAHLSPISTPRLYSDIASRMANEATASDIPLVVRLFAIDFVAEMVPGHPSISAGGSSYILLRVSRARRLCRGARPCVPNSVPEAEEPASGSAGTNEHNARHCHLTFCMPLKRCNARVGRVLLRVGAVLVAGVGREGAG